MLLLLGAFAPSTGFWYALPHPPTLASLLSLC